MQVVDEEGSDEIILTRTFGNEKYDVLCLQCTATRVLMSRGRLRAASA